MEGSRRGGVILSGMSIGIDVGILEEPRWTGVERAAAGLVRALGESASEDVLLYSRRPVDWPFPLAGRLVPRPLGGAPMVSVWREATLAPRLGRDGVRVLHSPVAAIPLATAVPRTATIHEMPWLAHPGIEGRWREARFRARIRVAARVAVRLFVPSATVGEDLLSLCPAAAGKVSVLPFGVEEAFRPLAAGAWTEDVRRRLGLPDGPVVLFVGKARRKKNLPVLVEAVRRLRAGMDPAPVLVLAGVEPGQVPSGPGILPLGFVPDEVLVPLYNLASVLAYPSLSEGFGFPPLEAMACGTPVVAADAGALPEVVRDAALLVDPGSPEALAAALRAAMTDRPVRDRLRDRGRDRAGAFRWAKAAESALRLLATAAA